MPFPNRSSSGGDCSCRAATFGSNNNRNSRSPVAPDLPCSRRHSRRPSRSEAAQDMTYDETGGRLRELLQEGRGLAAKDVMNPEGLRRGSP